LASVLGVDAAWTATQPSGVALVEKRNERWHLVALAASYSNFIEHWQRPFHEQGRPIASVVDMNMLHSAASLMTQDGSIDLVAIDMPLARTPIVSRRASDNAVSHAYGARKCGTHTPSAIRPGRISDAIRTACGEIGYPLLTREVVAPGLIEVYPHPALVELMNARERLPYKIAKIRSYWRSETPINRRGRLIEQWATIIDALANEIAGIREMLPVPAVTGATWELKAFEDALDAVVCAWVGICALEGRAVPYGDENSAIWIPVAVTAGG